MNYEVDTTAEPWPFDEGDHEDDEDEVGLDCLPQDDIRAEPPPLIVTRRGSQPAPTPASPPPLTRRSLVEANTAPQSLDQGQGVPPPLTVTKKGAEGPEIASQSPPPLEVKKPSGPPPLEIVRPAEAPVVEASEPTPPPLEITKRAPVEPPKLEVRHLAPVVYLMVGRNLLTEEIHLCQVIPEVEFRKLEKRGSDQLSSELMNFVTEDLKRIRASAGCQEINEHEDEQALQTPQVIPQRSRQGIVFEAHLFDYYYHNRADEEDEGEHQDPEKVYVWVIVRCDLKQIPRLNLSALLAD